jgi:Ca2+-binding EF-hand superfamily protein
MMVDLGYKASMDYLDGVMDSFATKEHDGANPAVQFEDFERLWKHLGGGEHAGAAAAAEGSQDTPYRAEFDKYNLNGDGLLSPLEVEQMMKSLGYKVNSDYVSEVLEIFGSFDEDGDGVIEPAEFGDLWEHLGAHKPDGEGGKAAPATDEPEQEPGRDLQKTFDSFDINKDGILDEAEVKGMMLKLGYKTTDDYVQQTMQLFASFDQDDDGLIQLEEFEPLWDHLGGDQIFSTPHAEVPEAVTSDPMYERFASFDLTGTGFLTRHEIQEMMAKLGLAISLGFLVASTRMATAVSTSRSGRSCGRTWEARMLWVKPMGQKSLKPTRTKNPTRCPTKSSALPTGKL